MSRPPQAAGSFTSPTDTEPVEDGTQAFPKRRGAEVLAEQVVKSYGTVSALRGLSFRVSPGEFVVIAGPSDGLSPDGVGFSVSDDVGAASPKASRRLTGRAHQAARRPTARPDLGECLGTRR